MSVVPSGRSAGGFRLYTDRDMEKLRKVKGMKPMGFALEEIRQVLELLEEAETPDAPPEVFERLQMYAALAVERRDKYRERLAMAVEFTAAITTIAGRGPGRS